MLSPEERQSARRLAEHYSSMLKDDEREQCLQRAHDMKDTLRKHFGDDDTAFKVARYMTLVLTVVGSTPAVQLADLLDGTVGAYGFAAGSLAGVYELPEREASEDESEKGIPFGIGENSDGSQTSDTGMYL